MTHTALLPKPVASDNTFSLAATWWLPDWQGSQGSRGSEDIGGGDIVKDDSDCMEHYNPSFTWNACRSAGMRRSGTDIPGLFPEIRHLFSLWKMCIRDST